MIIAIDGVAASGKGTLSEFLAKHYKCEFLPTGNLYRVVAKYLVDKKIDIEQFIQDPLKIDLIDVVEQGNILDEGLSDSSISEIASKIAKIIKARQVLTKFQRKWIQKRNIAVVEGRDIGTVVWPQAEVKLFLVADLQVRARRRMQQLNEKEIISEKEVYDSLVKRDQRDESRKIAPMKIADDAILLDTTNLTIDQTRKKAISLIEKKIDN